MGLDQYLIGHLGKTTKWNPSGEEFGYWRKRRALDIYIVRNFKDVREKDDIYYYAHIELTVRDLEKIIDVIFYHPDEIYDEDCGDACADPDWYRYARAGDIAKLLAAIQWLNEGKAGEDRRVYYNNCY